MPEPAASPRPASLAERLGELEKGVTEGPWVESLVEVVEAAEGHRKAARAIDHRWHTGTRRYLDPPPYSLDLYRRLTVFDLTAANLDDALARLAAALDEEGQR